jgi:glycerol uptake facilitator-like aquaporin
MVPSEVLHEVVGSNRDRLGEMIVRTVLGIWADPRARGPALGLLRSAVTKEGAARMLREFVSEAILSVVARAAEPADAEFRAALVASQIVGLGLTRLVLKIEPIASASHDDLARAIGPSIQRYLVGDLRAQPDVRAAHAERR